MGKGKIGNGKELLAEAKSVQKGFLKLGTYWSLETCIESIIEKDYFDINPHAVGSAMILAKELDTKF